MTFQKEREEKGGRWGGERQKMKKSCIFVVLLRHSSHTKEIESKQRVKIHQGLWQEFNSHTEIIQFHTNFASWKCAFNSQFYETSTICAVSRGNEAVGQKLKAPEQEQTKTNYLGRQQSVGVETFHVGHQVVLWVDDILDKHAVEKEPVGPAVHRDAFWDFTITQPPHVGVTLKEETIQTLLTDKPRAHAHARLMNSHSGTSCNTKTLPVVIVLLPLFSICRTYLYIQTKNNIQVHTKVIPLYYLYWSSRSLWCCVYITDTEILVLNFMYLKCD